MIILSTKMLRWVEVCACSELGPVSRYTVNRMRQKTMIAFLQRWIFNNNAGYSTTARSTGRNKNRHNSVRAWVYRLLIAHGQWNHVQSREIRGRHHPRRYEHITDICQLVATGTLTRCRYTMRHWLNTPRATDHCGHRSPIADRHAPVSGFY